MDAYEIAQLPPARRPCPCGGRRYLAYCELGRHVPKGAERPPDPPPRNTNVARSLFVMAAALSSGLGGI